MRYISAKNLKDGMILASPLYGSNFNYLMGEGMTLTEQYIKRIRRAGYPGAYVKDDVSHGISANDLIPYDQRVSLIQAAKQILTQAESGYFSSPRYRLTDAQQTALVSPIISAVIDYRDGISDFVDLKPRDDYPYYHAVNATVLSILIAIDLGLSGPQLFELALAALLHDVGNMFIPKNILAKPSSLTEDEYNVVKDHAENGFRFLRDGMGLPVAACVGALHHHECYDGSGYPYGLSQDRISIYGKIIAVADAYDAMVSQRHHRTPLFPSEALAIIDKGSGKIFDPAVVNSLHHKVALYLSGTCLQLSTGSQCIVYKNYVNSPAKPKVRLLNSSVDIPIYMDFSRDPSLANVRITRIIPL